MACALRSGSPHVAKNELEMSSARVLRCSLARPGCGLFILGGGGGVPKVFRNLLKPGPQPSVSL